MKKFYRSTTNSRLAGICGGLAEMMELDPSLVRLGFVFLALVTGIFPLLVTYVVGWIIIPDDRSLR